MSNYKTAEMKQTANEIVSIEAIFSARADMLWKAWTEPFTILKWFGSDPNGQGLKAKMDVRINGSFEISFKDSDGTEHTCSGIYIAVEELNKLAFTWQWKNEPGIESLVTILFIPGGSNTKMHFEHANVGKASKHNYLAGWKTTFKKLESLLATS